MMIGMVLIIGVLLFLGARLMSVGIAGNTWQDAIIVVLACVILFVSGMKVGDMFK